MSFLFNVVKKKWHKHEPEHCHGEFLTRGVDQRHGGGVRQVLAGVAVNGEQHIPLA